jgi:hypothetical protein
MPHNTGLSLEQAAMHAHRNPALFGTSVVKVCIEGMYTYWHKYLSLGVRQLLIPSHVKVLRSLPVETESRPGVNPKLSSVITFLLYVCSLTLIADH